jgi:signal transduction histidine kinase
MQDQDIFENNFLEKVEKFLKNAMFSATMLNNLINDMMDLAKMESGTFIFHDDYFDLVETIQNSFEVLRYLSEKNQIQMSYKIIDERDKSLKI